MIGELDGEHCRMLLATKNIGRIACSAAGVPYVVPVTYVYEDDCIYGHTNEGKKVQMMRENPRVCFEVDEIHDPNLWRSVVVHGRFEELHGEDAANGFDRLMHHLSPMASSESSLPADAATSEKVGQWIRLGAKKGIVYRIKIDEVSGRYERH